MEEEAPSGPARKRIGMVESLFRTMCNKTSSAVRVGSVASERPEPFFLCNVAQDYQIGRSRATTSFVSRASQIGFRPEHSENLNSSAQSTLALL
jgi:hypothetical protein